MSLKVEQRGFEQRNTALLDDNSEGRDGRNRSKEELILAEAHTVGIPADRSNAYLEVRSKIENNQDLTRVAASAEDIARDIRSIFGNMTDGTKLKWAHTFDSEQTTLPEDFVQLRKGRNRSEIIIEYSYLDISRFFELDNPLLLHAIEKKQSVYSEDPQLRDTLLTWELRRELKTFFSDRNLYPAVTITGTFEEPHPRDRTAHFWNLASLEAENSWVIVESKNTRSSIDQKAEKSMELLEKLKTRGFSRSPLSILGQARCRLLNAVAYKLEQEGQYGTFSMDFGKLLPGLEFSYNDTLYELDSDLPSAYYDLFSEDMALDPNPNYHCSKMFGLEDGLHLPQFTPFRYRPDRQLRDADGLLNGMLINFHLRNRHLPKKARDQEHHKCLQNYMHYLMNTRNGVLIQNAINTAR